MASLAVWPMASAHLSAAEETGWRRWAQTEVGLPEWTSWIFPGLRNSLYGFLADLPSFQFDSPPSQHSNGVGFVTSGVAIAGLASGWRRAVVRVAVLTFVVVLVLTMQIGDFTLWRFVYTYLPGARAIRFVARIGMYLPILAGLGVALCLERARGRSRVLAVVLGALCVAEQFHRLPGVNEEEYRSLVVRIAAEVDPDCEAFVLTTRATERTAENLFQRMRLTQLLAMWAGIEAGKPTINGFYGNRPPDWRLSKADLIGPGDVRVFMRDLNDWLRHNDLDPSRVDHVAIPRSWVPWLQR